MRAAPTEEVRARRPRAPAAARPPTLTRRAPKCSFDAAGVHCSGAAEAPDAATQAILAEKSRGKGVGALGG